MGLERPMVEVGTLDSTALRLLNLHGLSIRGVVKLVLSWDRGRDSFGSDTASPVLLSCCVCSPAMVQQAYPKPVSTHAAQAVPVFVEPQGEAAEGAAEALRLERYKRRFESRVRGSGCYGAGGCLQLGGSLGARMCWPRVRCKDEPVFM